MQVFKRFLYTKKVMAGLGIAAVALGIILMLVVLPKGTCYPVYTLTYIPSPYTLSEVKFNKVAEGAMNCTTEAVRYINGDSMDWSLEEREKEIGLKTYRFDTKHMEFSEENGRKYAFVNDRNNNPALLGFIENTFVYITNTTKQKLSREDMIAIFKGLQKK